MEELEGTFDDTEEEEELSELALLIKDEDANEEEDTVSETIFSVFTNLA